MESSSQGSKRGPWTTILALAVAYILSRAIFAASGFRYDVFREPFNAVKLLIDFGVWALLYVAVLWGLNRLFRRA